MRTKLLLTFMGFPVFLFAQSAEEISGVVVSDALEVKKITVTNKKSGRWIYTDAAGKFKIHAAENDTLVFTAVAFLPKEIMVGTTDFHRIMRIELEPAIIALKEVNIPPYKLTGNLAFDSKNIKTKSDTMRLHFGRLPSIQPKRAMPNGMPPAESPLTGVDFIMIGNQVRSWFPKSENGKEPPPRLKDDPFIQSVKEKFPTDFFTQKLKIKEEDTMLFLQYCDANQPKDFNIMLPEKQLELTDFLIKMAAEFTSEK